MNPDTASLSECCDALAEFRGWRFDSEIEPVWYRNSRFQKDHPIRDLDSIAGALPEDARWDKVKFWFGGIDHDDTFIAEIDFATIPNVVEGEAVMMGNDRISAIKLSMARAAVKAWLVVKGSR